MATMRDTPKPRGWQGTSNTAKVIRAQHARQHDPKDEPRFNAGSGLDDSNGYDDDDEED